MSGTQYTSGMTASELRRIPLFANLGDAELEQLLGQARTITVQAGETIIEEGSEDAAIYVVLSGELDVYRSSGEHEVHLRTVGPRAFIGEMALLAGGIRSATVRAMTDSRLLVIDRDSVQELLSTNASASKTLLETVMMRVASTEELLVHHHKLASLGTLAAGIAHELNNPVSAMSRGASQLRSTLVEWEEATEHLGELMRDRQFRDSIAQLRTQMTDVSSTNTKLDPITRSELEEQIAEWLEQHHVPNSWDLAETFVSSGWDLARMDALAQSFAEEQLPIVIRWTGTGLGCGRLISNIEMATSRITDLVTGIKSYANLDRAPIQDVDVQEGIRNSLVILGHKLGNVRVVEHYDNNLPMVGAYPGELNQVWSNLIENALDAMGGDGELSIRTYRSGQTVVVEIGDTGPGIPEQVQRRMFDPFFTTKAPGAGSGLGLHVSYNVVVVRHHGEIKVESKPGRTLMRVTLPIRMTSG